MTEVQTTEQGCWCVNTMKLWPIKKVVRWNLHSPFVCATKDGDLDGIELNSNRRRLVWTSVDFHPAHHRRRSSYSIVISRKCYTKWTQIIEIASLTLSVQCSSLLVRLSKQRFQFSFILYLSHSSVYSCENNFYESFLFRFISKRPMSLFAFDSVRGPREIFSLLLSRTIEDASPEQASQQLSTEQKVGLTDVLWFSNPQVKSEIFKWKNGKIKILENGKWACGYRISWCYWKTE